jgi:hypothetical protein
MTLHASSEAGAVMFPDGRTARERFAGNGFGQGWRRARELWRHVWPTAVTLSISGLLMIAAVALGIAVWVPLGRVTP